ncbi:MAG TPA: hypothetical protein EYO01_00505 [Phycisphaerales bacterium]|nr:hypothetical protein [Phycisphaerales bacterium]HIB01155.1 hypothetical protein [Phycisphaerales bacterium]HIB49847.1 hypothetical protein [Phycisphaerales bacterium]HIN84309.1 hypothetical protein [Phycisphaerales bacterium]HIO52520.1 hypothetical protein [Phycisphaerales bacterium]
MAKYAPPSIWTDEYNTPDVKDLKKRILEDGSKAIDKLSSKIAALGDVTEEVIWFGDCWFWTIAYMTEYSEKPLAIVIPFEEDMQIASQLSHEFIDQLSTRRLKRFVRDGIELAMPPHETEWAIWSAHSPAAVEDVMPVLKSLYKFNSQ